MERFSTTTTKTKPWKNGGGITREFCANVVEGRVQWRISLADITKGGAFSTFRAMSRVLTIVAGQGIILTGEGEKICADPSKPMAFNGALELDCELADGPTQALNIMWDSCVVRADVKVLKVGRFNIAAGGHTAIYVLKGTVQMNNINFVTGEGALLTNTQATGVIQARAKLWVAQISSG